MRTQLHRRGAAATELVVLMVTVIPLIFYVIFLQDLLLYRLDQQETITSAPWDFAVVNYQKEKYRQGMMDSVNVSNQLQFCDHTSAYDSYTDSDCNGREAMEHHNAALAAHACWVSSGAAQQVLCNTDRNFMVGIQHANVQRWHGDFGTGGLTQCSARLAAFNKFVPQKFLNMGAGPGGGGWSQAMVIKKKAFSDKNGGFSGAIGQTHNVSMGPGTGVTSVQTISDPDNFHFELDFFSVLHDPWSVNDHNIPTITPRHISGAHVLWDRSLSPSRQSYWNQNRNLAQPASDYVQAASDAFHSDMDVDNKGDKVPNAPMHWTDSQQRPNLGDYSSGWADSRHPGAAGAVKPIYEKNML
jgi:hypothetical protein